MDKCIGYLFGIVLVLIGLLGCGDTTSRSADKDAHWKPGEKIELIMATGGTGGTYYPLGGGMAKLWKDTIPGVNVTVQATGASVANARLLGKKEADLALIQNDIADYGRTGKEAFAEMKEKYTNYLAMGSLYPEVVQIVVPAEGSIHKIDDLRGKKVVVGAAGSGTELASRQILAAYGMTYKDSKDLTPLFLGFAEGATALKDNSANAQIIVSGIPNASLADVQTTTSIRLLPVDLARLKNVYPFYIGFIASAGTYKGMDRDIEVVALKATLVVRDEISTDLVYEMTKALFEKAGALGHSKAKEFDVKLAAQGVTIPFHPGAAKYLKEQGVDLEK